MSSAKHTKCCVVLCCVVLCRVVLCCVVLCCVVLCCVVLCCAVHAGSKKKIYTPDSKKNLNTLTAKKI